MKTNYSQAWLKFRKSDDYKRLMEVMKKQGIKQPYSSNILKLAFAEGWRATDKEIIIIK